MSARTLAIAALLVGIAAGTLADRPRPSPPLSLGGYRVVTADLHTHSSMWSDGALTPWGLVLEAERQGLDAIAVTGHNEVFDAKVARWFSNLVGGPTILTGQEILAPGHHVIAVGIEHVVDHRLSVPDQIDEVHRQGGVAIAAHPVRDFWRGYNETARNKLDGAEVCHPLIYVLEQGQEELESFLTRAPLAAIGSSDTHGPGRMGLCRTYIFATDDSALAIVDALRQHRTVVYGLEGRVYGDTRFVEMAATVDRLRVEATTDRPHGALDWISLIVGLIGLIGLIAPAAGPLLGPKAQGLGPKGSLS
jgi:predicted metal-dependent phosphoesterase TrpH